MMQATQSRAPRRNLFVLFLASVFFTTPAAAQVSEWVDIEVHDGHVFVETIMGGIPGYAMIDTGAEINALNAQFLEQAKLDLDKGRKVEIAGIYGREERDLYDDVPVTLFGSELRFNDIVSIDLGSPDIQMIIGAGFLKLFVFQFDYPNNRMRIITRDTIDLKASSNIKSRKERFGSSPIVKARLNDEKTVWLMLDTGNNSGIFLDRDIARKQKWLKKFPLQESSVQGAISSGDIEQFVLPKIQLGEFEISNPLVSVPKQGQEAEYFREEGSTASRVKRTNRFSVGILGYDVLKHFVVTIDYQTGLVHLEPG